ncbi:hypothetical protein CYMTET_15870, partial [Cymbomonas tetramitiformis]
WDAADPLLEQPTKGGGELRGSPYTKRSRAKPSRPSFVHIHTSLNSVTGKEPLLEGWGGITGDPLSAENWPTKSMPASLTPPPADALRHTPQSAPKSAPHRALGSPMVPRSPSGRTGELITPQTAIALLPRTPGKRMNPGVEAELRRKYIQGPRAKKCSLAEANSGDTEKSLNLAQYPHLQLGIIPSSNSAYF